MRRRLVTTLFVAIAGLSALAEPAMAAVPTGLSLDADAPDPYMLKAADGRYYAYSTEVYFKNVPVRSSTSPSGGWGTVSDALPKMPTWAQTGRTWAPAVTRFGSTYVMHFTAWHKGSGRQCIGAATSSSPAGPFTPTSKKPLVCQLEFGGSIDASVFREGDNAYLLWKSEDNALERESRIWSQKLSSGGTAFASYTSPGVLVQHSHGTWEGYTIEGPTMAKGPDGRYHLFFSAGFWSDHQASIGRAVCSQPTGGCGAKSQWLTSVDDPKGPSGPEVFSDGSTLRFVHHGWRPQNGYVAGTSNRRAMYAGTLTFDSSGTPVLGS